MKAIEGLIEKYQLRLKILTELIKAGEENERKGLGYHMLLGERIEIEKDLKQLQNQTDFEIIKGAFDRVGVEYCVGGTVSGKSVIQLDTRSNCPRLKGVHACTNKFLFTKSGKLVEVV